MAFDQLAVGEQDALPPGNGCVAPGGECLARRGHGAVYLGLGGEGHLTGNLTGGRIEDVAGTLRLRGGGGTADVVLNEIHGADCGARLRWRQRAVSAGHFATTATLCGRFRPHGTPPANVPHPFTDLQRWDTIRALGAPGMRTPTFDRLAAEGGGLYLRLFAH